MFAIHSEWVDEASFELHATLPHTVRFLAAAETLRRVIVGHNLNYGLLAKVVEPDGPLIAPPLLGFVQIQGAAEIKPLLRKRM